MRAHLIAAVAISSASLAGALSAQSYRYTVTDLGTAPGQGSPLAWGINEAGTQVAGWFSFPTLGWIYDAANGMVPVGALPGAAFSAARDVNDAGQIVGSSWVTTIQQPGHAFRISPGVGMVDLGTLGGATSEAWRINDAGQVVGDSGLAGSSSGSQAFLYTDGVGMVRLTPLSSTSYGRGISRDGQAAGYMLAGNTWHAFRHTPSGGLADLGAPAGFAHTFGYAINGAGQVAGMTSTASGSIQRLVRWTPGLGWQVLGGLGTNSAAWAINASGTVVGEAIVGALYGAVMYADGLGFVDLNALIDPASGWYLRSAHDINDAGQIVGYGRFGPNGETRAFRLDPIVRSSLATAGPGCAALVPPVLSATLPHLAQTMTASVAQAQPGALCGLLAGVVPAQPTPLGFGCSLYFDLGSAVTLATAPIGASGTFGVSFVIPDQPAILGAQVVLQAALVPTTGPAGFDLSNGLVARIGF